MKFTTFDRQITELKKFYDEACLKDKKLEEALGGDTQVMTDWWGSVLDGMLDSIKSEFGLAENDDTIDWLFYDCICGNEELTFEDDGIRYIGNTKNVYLSLTGMLDERFGETPKMSEKDDTKPEQNEMHKENSELLDEDNMINKAKKYFEAAGVIVSECTTKDEYLETIRETLNADSFYEDIKELCYDEQLFRICVEDVKLDNNKYNIVIIKLKEEVQELYSDPVQALHNKG